MRLTNKKSQNDKIKYFGILFSFVRFALICSYLPATILNINEAVSVNQLVYCHDHHMNGIPLWVLTMTDVSNFCVFIFSSINLLFVMLPNAGYRKHCADFFKCKGWGPFTNCETHFGVFSEQPSVMSLCTDPFCIFT